MSSPGVPQPAGPPSGGRRGRGRPEPDPLTRFSAPTRTWFRESFTGPTAAQQGAWEAISRGEHALVVAPTGSGKTLAAFLWALDRLVTQAPEPDGSGCRVLYVSPLKALAADVERNLRAPLAGIRNVAARSGLEVPPVRVGMRSGDSTAQDRRELVRTPPDILITTPESLFLLLTSRARTILDGVHTVIVDEVHVLAGSKRGAHLALTLARLDHRLAKPAQRVGLSATVNPVQEVARWLGNSTRPVQVVQPPSAKVFDLQVVVPVPDLTELDQGPSGAVSPSAAAEPDLAADPGSPRRPSIWPHVEERVVDLVAGHTSTLVFANSRRLAERLTARLNEVWQERTAAGEHPARDPGSVVPAAMMGASGAALGVPPVLARAHHGSVSKEQRAVIEGELKAGRLPAVVATSSLELGIDMGAVDLVVQVESPPSVASGLQRVGRAGHQVGAVSRGVIFPKFRSDLLATAVVVERMRQGAIEPLGIPRNPLDVLAQQVVAMVAMDDWSVTDLEQVVRAAAPFTALGRGVLESVLDMLSGRYPSEDFAELRPRLVWDRLTGTLSARPGAQLLAVTSGGTIPDRGLYGVFLATAETGGTGARDTGGAGRRVGELDEEMVYESRVGDVFTLGTSSWRIEQITHDRVLVTPAPGQPGRLPFWKGDSQGRPAELGRAIGEFVRELDRLPAPAALERVRAAGLDQWAAENLLAYLEDQRAATGRLPDDRTVVIERFRDELGDWTAVVHSPLGARVHAPLALALAALLRERLGVDVQAMPGDDGIVLRLPDTDGEGRVPALGELLTIDPDDVEPLVTAQLGGSAVFAARFRECAARALLLPRRRPGKRQPLWQQRQRSAQLLEVAARYDSFPIVLETVRECLQEVFDVPAVVDLMRGLAARRVRIVEVETPTPSPFARSLLFGYVAQFLYEGDSPLAERRAAALALDPALLGELLGRGEGASLRDLLDPQALARTEAELQFLTPERRLSGPEGVADLLRVLGPLRTEEVAARLRQPGDGDTEGHLPPDLAAEWLGDLELARRVIQVRVAGERRWAAVEDAGRLRDALGTPLPVGVAEVFTEPVVDPLADLLTRFARRRGPFTAALAAEHFGLGVAVVTEVLRRLVGEGRLVEGELRPLDSGGGQGSDHCHPEVLRTIRRRSLAALRAEVEPVPQPDLARFLPAWQGVGGAARGADGVLRAVEQLAGALLPAGALESLILPARVPGYRPAMLDELTAAGEVLWSGHGALPGNDGWVSLHPGDLAPLTVPAPDPELELTPLHRSILDTLGGGAFFFRALADNLPEATDDAVATALWELLWAGWLTNDTLAPLRHRLAGSRGAARPGAAAPRARPGSRYAALRAARGLAAARSAPGGRSGPATVAGRWSVLPEREPDPTLRAHAQAEVLLERHGVLTRGAAVSERIPGGFAATYRVLSAFEDAGRVRRGYFVEGLGAAQFGTSGAIDRLRTPGSEAGGAVVLAAADPASPYGAALAWPERTGRTEPGEVSHRPGRGAGALVVLVGGELVLYVERGGRSLLSWTEDPDRLQAAADALALAVREGALGRITVERADGAGMLVGDHPLARALAAAGFHATPRGLRIRR